MITAILLIVLGTLLRLAPHPPNAACLGALALYAGARLPRRWALAVPFATMLLSDVWIDWRSGTSNFDLVRLSVYVSFAIIALLGRTLRTTSNPWRRSGIAIVGSAIFFVVTNFAFWCVYSGQINEPARTIDGLAQSYLWAIPFYVNNLVGDLIGTAVLFGLDGLSRRVFASRSEQKPSLVVE